MKRLLFKIPAKNQEKLFLYNFHEKTGIDLNILNMLKKFLKDDFWFFLSLLSNNVSKSVTLLANDKLDEIGLSLKVFSEMETFLQKNGFGKSITKIAKNYKLSTNQVFTYYINSKHMIKRMEDKAELNKKDMEFKLEEKLKLEKVERDETEKLRRIMNKEIKELELVDE